MQLMACGLAGLVVAWTLAAWRGFRGLRSLAIGIASGSACYFVLYEVLYPAIAPLIPLYSNRAAPLLGHMLVGIALSRAGAIYRELQPDNDPPADCVELDPGGSPEPSVSANSPALGASAPGVNSPPSS